MSSALVKSLLEHAANTLERARKLPSSEVRREEEDTSKSEELAAFHGHLLERYAAALEDPPREIARIRDKVDLLARWRWLRSRGAEFSQVLVIPESLPTTPGQPPEIDAENWAWGDLLWKAFSAPKLFDRYQSKHAEFQKRSSEISRKARDLAKTLSETASGLESRSVRHFPVFSGLVWERIYSQEWDSLLRRFADLSKSRNDDSLLGRHFMDLDLLNATDVLMDLLLGYAERVESDQLTAEDQEYINLHSRKSNLKLFTQRLVFNELNRHWTERRAPNKATADLVNLVLELSGDEEVTPDLISKMNSKTRRRYCKDED